MFFLINIIISIIVGIIDSLLGLTITLSPGHSVDILGVLYSLALIIPSFAIGVRRLHDTNLNGLWVLLGFIPILGWIVLIVLLARKGVVGENAYGPAPLSNLPNNTVS